MSTIKEKSINGFIWNIFGNGFDKLVTVLIGFILARLLGPGVFGQLAMIYFVFEVSEVLVRGGFREALIRKDEITETDLSTVFWINLIVASVLYVAIFFLAPLIAGFFGDPQLDPLVKFMGISVLFRALFVIQEAKLVHQIDFKRLKLIQSLSIVVSAVVAVIMAFMDFGVWALATRFNLQVIIMCVALYIRDPWKPKEFINLEAFRNLFGFGANLMLSSLLDKLFSNVYSVTIGKLYSVGQLGMYSQANNLRMHASKTIVDSLQQVSYPVLSKSKGDIPKLRDNYRKILQLSSYVIFPVTMMMLLFSRETVQILLGNKWTGTSQFLEILLIMAFSYHFIALNKNILKVLGKSREILIIEIVKKIIIVLGLIVGSFFGLMGLVWSQAITSIILFALTSHISSRYINFGLLIQVRDNLPLLLLLLPTVLIGLVYRGLTADLGHINYWAFGASLVSCILAYIALSYLMKNEQFMEMRAFVMKKIVKRI